LQVVRGLQSTVGTMQQSMGNAMAGVADNMERSMAMMATMNTVMDQYLTESVQTGESIPLYCVASP
jgi:hypothetical protein